MAGASPSPLVVVIPHRLGKTEVLRRLKPGLSSAAQSFPILKVEEEQWSEDRLSFRVQALGQIASGTVDAADDHVRLEVVLPLFIARFAEKIKSVVAARGKLLIEKAPS